MHAGRVDADDLANGTATRESDSGKLTWRFHAENVRDCAVSIGRTYVWDATHAVVKDKHGAGQDGTGTRRGVETIVTGLHWRAVQEAQIYRGDWRDDFIGQCRDLGAAMAAGLDAGIF